MAWIEVTVPKDMSLKEIAEKYGTKSVSHFDGKEHRTLVIEKGNVFGKADFLVMSGSVVKVFR